MIILLLLASYLLSFAQAKKGLDIHLFDVGQADAQLIVFPSGYSILVDAGEKKTGSMNCKMIAERIKAILGKSHVDVAVLTHLHLDHVGMPFTNGFWYLMEKAGITFGKFIDRDAGVIKSRVTQCTGLNSEDVDWHNVGTYSSTALKWLCYATNSNIKNAMTGIREIAVPCSNQINPPDEGASVEIVISDALGVNSDGKPLAADYHDQNDVPSENDYSISLRIQLGDFVYSTSGDLDGQDNSSRFGYLYHNVESSYKDVVGEVDLYKANHHGSEHSNNAEWLGVLKPTVSLISCGHGNLYKHPTEPAVSLMNKYSKKIYLTEDCNAAVTDKFDKIVIVGNEIIVHYPVDGSTFTVTDLNNTFKHSYNVKKNKPQRKACGVI
ncbi:competence protein comec putative [Entamoeba histolytica]|uniref:Competence protein ComEC, putative n=3 Tax=Entamoeba histolytica TaxID=5759 RepID=C4M250_ENTH1|nr:competence protein ComEC, putative [Entamoeba histolytica HM-1:IMSS]EAL50451.2 competence protein ComEC, putative [Entamoeba histolytica HM-1:IMSS]GAT95340.1 competence protein comec putative [Entamoeba histolytica]|eukprot:XP_655837.2 competence protein ComEC, putative [Entamoeba histolytica HM-1:IMSS]